MGSCWYSLVNEVAKTPFLSSVCVRKQRCKHTYLKSGFLIRMTKESSLPKPLHLPKPIAWSQIRTVSRIAPWVFDFGLFGFLSRWISITSAPLLWTGGSLSTDWEITNHCSETTLVPVTNGPSKGNQSENLIIWYFTGFEVDTNALYPATSDQSSDFLWRGGTMWNNVILTRHLNVVSCQVQLQLSDGVTPVCCIFTYYPLVVQIKVPSLS